MDRRQRRTPLFGTLIAGAFLASACSSGNNTEAEPTGNPGGGTTDFAVSSTTILDGAQWQLNRAIEVTFNQDIDFDTVSSSTIQIIDNQGLTAVGTFTASGSRTVRFQPRCPTNDDNSNGGLRKGGLYTLSVPALGGATAGSGVTVQSAAGESLDTGLNVSFSTPDSNDPLVLFVDVVAGPPQVRVRGLSGEPVDSTVASYIEFGEDPNNIEFFQFSTAQAGTGLPNTTNFLPFDVPLNLYSRLSDRFSIVLRFNQPIFAASSNVNSALIGIEFGYEQTPGAGDVLDWEDVPSEVEIIDNCTDSGASVRIRPQGVLPQGAFMRVVVREGFEDLTGDRVQATQAQIARMQATSLGPSAGGLDPNQGVDAILAGFNVGGGGAGSLEDTEIASSVPRANWGIDGTLAADYDFEGTGGPDGQFDWVIRTGEQVFLNTDGDQITGGPGGVASDVQSVFNGLVNVRDMTIEEGGQLIIQGTNTCTILATGRVLIEGSLDLDGGTNLGVGTLNTTNQPEEGANGNVGGGAGGTGSFLTSQSTPRGGTGNGAFDVPGLGGQGGETSYAPPSTCAIENRRGAGGGGGRLGDDVLYVWNGNFVRCQTLVGMDAEPGFMGSPDGTGAISQAAAAVGGSIAPSPFIDTNSENNFFGSKLTSDNRLILGELTRVWAGSGGGAGGDAVRSATFPLTPFSPIADEKGSGGGGGAGGILILSQGNIEVRGEGSITANGGDGGAGENTIFFDRIGGGAGGGSGGHIVMSSAQSIIFEAEATATTVGNFYLDDPNSPTHQGRPVSAIGGQGGAGKDSRCGANEDGPSQWRTDAIPLAAFEGDTTVPPQAQTVWQLCNRIDNCSVIMPPTGTVPGGGGDGGPGIIQLHVADPATQLQFGANVAGAAYDPTRSMVPPPFGWSTPDPAAPAPDQLIPFFSSQSEAFSQWVPLGLARFNADGSSNDVELLFEGTNGATGVVNSNGTLVQELTPLVAYTPLTIGGAVPSVTGSTSTFTFSGVGFDDLYIRNAALLEQFAVRLREGDGSNGVENEFVVASATYDSGSNVFSVVVDPQGSFLSDLLDAPPTAGFQVELVPFFLRFRSGGAQDAYPFGTEVIVTFDAMRPDATQPDGMREFSEDVNGGSFATDISQLNAEAWDFVRFRVQFDIGVLGEPDPFAPRPGIDFLRIPYRF